VISVSRSQKPVNWPTVLQQWEPWDCLFDLLRRENIYPEILKTMRLTSLIGYERKWWKLPFLPPFLSFLLILDERERCVCVCVCVCVFFTTTKTSLKYFNQKKKIKCVIQSKMPASRIACSSNIPELHYFLLPLEVLLFFVSYVDLILPFFFVFTL